MANSFKEAANKRKKSAGGLPEELTAGVEEPKETVSAEPETEKIVEEVQQPEQKPEVAAAPQNKAPTGPMGLVEAYAAEMRAGKQSRSVRLQAVITPDLNAKLNKAISEGTISSRNDLVNNLLEWYFAEAERLS